MGNQLAPGRYGQSESLAELPNVVFKDSLGDGRVFKTSLCVHDDGGLVVVKVYPMLVDSPEMRPYEEKLLDIRSRLAGVAHPHAWPVHRVYRSERAVFLVRQYMAANLAQRTTSRPFLTHVEKVWLAYQILLGLAQCAEAGVCHGDVKPENVALTSWGWAFLVDFAPYKPVMLPAEHSHDFSVFFDNSGRRRCCLAPERFYGPGAPPPAPLPGLTPAMDVFSAGCVIAELFLDGQPLFDYSRLLAYRQGSFDPRASLAGIGDPGVRALVGHMVQLDPAARLPAADYLAWPAFPGYLGATIHPFFAEVLPLDTDARVALVTRQYAALRGSLAPGVPAWGAAALPPSPAPQGPERPAQPAAHGAGGLQAAAGGTTRQAALLAEAQALVREASSPSGRGEEPAVQRAVSASPAPLEAEPAAGSAAPAGAAGGGEGMSLLAVLLCTLLRGCRQGEGKAVLAGLLVDTAVASGDDAIRLQRVVPYLVAASGEALSGVKCAALRGLGRVLAVVGALPPSDLRVVPDYVLPSLSRLPGEAEVAVAVEYAATLSSLAASGRRFLEQAQQAQQGRLAAAAAPAGPGAAADGGGGAFSFDEEWAHLRLAVERAAQSLLLSLHLEPRMAALAHLPALSASVGRRDTTDVLLPPLLTYPNSQEWQVRACFYAHFDGVCWALGSEGVVAIVLPFLDRMLGDTNPAVASEAVLFLSRLLTRGLLLKRHTLGVARKLCARGLLQSPSTAVRAAAVQYLATAAAQLTPADTYALFLPMLAPHILSDPLDPKSPARLAAVLRGAPTLAWEQPEPVQQPGGAASQAAPRLRPPGTLMRRSLDSVRPPPAAAPAAAPLAASTLVVPPSPHYWLEVGPAFLHPNSSYLAAALEQSALHASASDARRSRAEAGAQLVARARRGAAQGGSAAEAHAQMVASNLGLAFTGGPGRGAGGAAAGPSAAAAAAPPSVRVAVQDAVGASMPEAGEGAIAAAPWYPRGVLIAHLEEHRKAVTGMAAAAGGAFFATASADETVKIWDCRRLERDVSFRSRLTYAGQEGRITGVAACQDGTTMASASAGGSLHVWSVEYTARAGGTPNRYTGIRAVRQACPDGGAVLGVSAWGPSLLLFSTAARGLTAWDLRTGGEGWSLPAPLAQGYVGHWVCDPGHQNWLVTGSHRGHLTLWDTRFLLPAASWQHPTGAAVTAMALASAPLARLGLPPGAAAGPLAYVAAGEGEVGLWDVAGARCLQVLRTLPPGASESVRRAVPAALAPPPVRAPPSRPSDAVSRAKALGLAEVQAPQPPPPGCRALLATAGGQLLAAGTDRAIRCWDSGRLHQSYVVCVPPAPVAVLPGEEGGGVSGVTAVDTPKFTYSQRSVAGVAVVEESGALERSLGAGASSSDSEGHVARMGWAERAAAACHQQAVLGLLRVEAPEPLLLSCGRDGAVKAWR